MNIITNSNNLSTISITPYKYSICSLIYSFSIRTNYIFQYSIETESFIYYETITELLNLLPGESTKSELIKDIESLIFQKAQLHNITDSSLIKQLQTNVIKLLNSNLSKIKNINDIYNFFKESLSILQPNRILNEQTIQRSQFEQTFIEFDSGGYIDNFLRKCTNNFNKMSFNDLIHLFENIFKFNNNEIINNILSSKENEKLFENYFNKSPLNSTMLKSMLNKDNEYTHLSSFINTNKNILINDKLYNIHKFYDHNLQYIYNDNLNANESKIHYSLLYLINLYYESGYYEKAIQVVFECVKLSQSNCDHEALLKCFLWLSKIFIQTGNFDLASQCLSTCLIKSFQNNFQLLYLLSSIELVNLNFVFNSEIGLTNSNTASIKSLEEKILSHSNNCLHLYKNISDYYTLMNEKEIKGDLNTMINYTHTHLIYNLMRKGEYSLAIDYTKIYLNEIYRNASTLNNITATLNEIISNVISLLMNIMEFDYCFAIETIYDILMNKQYKDIYGYHTEFILWIVLNKYFIEHKGVDLYRKINMQHKQQNNETIGIYYHFIAEYYSLKHKVLSIENGIIYDELENDILNYISKCKQFHILHYKTRAVILLSKLYIFIGKITEAILILSKVTQGKNSTVYEITKAKIAMCYCYYELGFYSKIKELLKEIEVNINNVCSIPDKFDYYYMKYLNDVHNYNNNNYEYIYKCIRYAIQMNNLYKINKVISLVKNDQFLKEINDGVIIKNEKLIQLVNQFNINVCEAIEIVYLINKNNEMFISNNSYLKNLKQN